MKLGITHPIFADDLLVFTKGDLLSIQTVVQTLDFFGMISGLKAKPAKSCIYFGGLSNAEQERIL